MIKRLLIIIFILTALSIGFVGLRPYLPYVRQYLPTGPYRTQEAGDNNLAALARQQIGVTVEYNPSYEKLSYPGGDVPMKRGVCTDVVIRALRLKGIDLQKEVHEDMSRHFSAYPNNWGLRRPDRNIDHRRVPNLQTFFKRRGWSLPVTDNPADYKPGDLVTCTVGGNLPHIMIVSDRSNAEGVPLIIHNIGGGTEEEDALFMFPLNGHYRVQLAGKK